MKESFSEKHLTLSNGVVGILNAPNHSQKKFPIVLMLHGFASDKNEVGNLFELLSNKLAEKNIASLRIDFFGWGESKGDSFNSSINTHLEDVSISYNYILELDNIDKNNIALLGFSLGGGISLIFASENNEKIKTLALWSSVYDFKNNFLESLGKDIFDKAKTEKIIEVDLGWKKVLLGQEFFKSLSNFDLYNCLKEYNNSILSIDGTNDPQFYNKAKFNKLLDLKKNKLIFIEGADHIFNVLENSDLYTNILLNDTIIWFENNLKGV